MKAWFFKIFNFNKKYLAAISGGPDSMAMLNMYKKQIKVVCSVNYNKRENSLIDNKLVEKFCLDNHIKFCMLNVTKEIYDRYNLHNFQDLARKIRYDFFLETAKNNQLDTILIAHQKNDWLETAYIQEQKHSKSLYYGILKYGSYADLKIIRPLINCYKDTLQKYCQKNHIPFAIDNTNDLDIYQRNQVRKIINNWSPKELLTFTKRINSYNKKNQPLLKKVNKQFIIWSKQEYDYTFYQQFNDEIKYHLIYRFLTNHNLNHHSKQKIKSILDFLKNKSNKQFRLQNNYYLTIKNSKITLLQKK